MAMLSVWLNKMGYLPSCDCVSTTVWLHYQDSNETPRKKKTLDGNYTRILRAISNKTWKQKPTKSCCTGSYFSPSRETNKTLGTDWEVRTESWTTFSSGLLHMDISVLANQEWLTCISSSVRTPDAFQRNCKEKWAIDEIWFFFHHTTCESTCDTLVSSAANQGDNTVSVAQGGTATLGATEQLLPPDRVFKRNIYMR